MTYEDEMARFGSVHLRVHQVAQYLSHDCSLEVKPLSACYHDKNTLFIWVKPRRYHLFHKLLGRGNKVVVDLLDTVNLVD